MRRVPSSKQRGALGLQKIGFYRKEGEARKVLAKRKKELLKAKSASLEGGKVEGFYQAEDLLSWRLERPGGTLSHWCLSENS